jgi:hypothetical protein
MKKIHKKNKIPQMRILRNLLRLLEKRKKEKTKVKTKRKINKKIKKEKKRKKYLHRRNSLSLNKIQSKVASKLMILKNKIFNLFYNKTK